MLFRMKNINLTVKANILTITIKIYQNKINLIENFYKI